MTLVQRIRTVLGALLTILCAILLLFLKEDGYLLVCLLLSLSLIVYGVRTLIYYFTMARHMVDGRGVFFKGILILDFGVFTLSISQNYSTFIVFYLLFAHAFSGIVEVLRALEARRFQSGSWRLTMIQGFLRIGFAVAAVIIGFVIGDLQTLTGIYAIGLIWSAVIQFFSGFRKTAIVYIQ